MTTITRQASPRDALPPRAAPTSLKRPARTLGALRGAGGRKIECESFGHVEVQRAEAQFFDFDIEAKFSALSPPRVAELSRLRELGVPTSALCEPELLARARVVFRGDRALFDFADERGAEGIPEPAIIFLARNEAGEAIDMVAWSPASGRLAAWLGCVPLLGANSLWAPRIASDGALAVFESPLGWLKADRRGVVVVDPARAASQLRDAAPLLAETLELGNRLLAMTTAPAVSIVVPRSALGVTP